MLRFETVRAEELARRRGAVSTVLFGQSMRGEVLRLGRRECAIEAIDKPGAIADVVGVAMRRNDANDAFAAERSLEVGIPKTASAFVTVAAIDLCPAHTVRNKPQVDMVEREGQRHPQPVDSGYHLDDRSLGWRRRPWEAKVRRSGGEGSVHSMRLGLGRSARSV